MKKVKLRSGISIWYSNNRFSRTGSEKAVNGVVSEADAYFRVEEALKRSREKGRFWAAEKAEKS